MKHQQRFEKLLEPFNIGTVKTRNRLIKSGAGLQYWGQGENPVTEKVKRLHEAYARGGVGLIIMETPSMEKRRSSYRLDDKKQIHHMKELMGIIHRYDCPVFAQLANLANWNLNGLPDFDIRAPSAVCVHSEMDNHSFMPRAMSIAEIEDIVEKFATNAEGAKMAGFDGVEINAACSHLLHTFLSPFWNKRQDQYGCQSIETRTMILVQIIQEIKKRVGSDFPVTVLMNAIETGRLIGADDSECLLLEDSLKIAQILEKAGADALQVRSQWIGRHDASFLTDHMKYPEPPIPLKYFPKELDMSRGGAGANIPLAAAIKKVVGIPIITVGRFDPDLGEKTLREGKADFIAMTRRLFADPELPNKLAAGRIEDIAPCTSCTACKAKGLPRRCRINAALGSEKNYLIKPSKEKKNVIVIGGGPAGLEAARVAATRGHKVTLFEKSARLGGLLPVAALVKGLEVEDLPAIVRYFSGQLEKMGVDVKLCQKADAFTIEKMNPDIVILATGGVHTLPDIPGIEGSNVIKSSDLHRMLKQLLRFVGPKPLRRLTKVWMPIGKSVVIMGGGIQGCELAEFLVKRGREVTIVDETDELGEGIINHLKLQLFWWFREKGVTMLPGVKPVMVTDKGLTVMRKEGYKQMIKAESIVPAIPMKPDTEFFQELHQKFPVVHAIGDCCKPGLIVDAIAGGWRVGNLI